MVTRRNGIASLAAAALASSLPQPARCAGDMLEAVAVHHERFFGSAVRIGQLTVEEIKLDEFAASATVVGKRLRAHAVL